MSDLIIIINPSGSQCIGEFVTDKDSDGSSQTSPVDFPQCRYLALYEFQRLLGLTDQDLHGLLKVVGKSCMCMLDFNFGNLTISLTGFDDGEVRLGLDLEQGTMEKSAGYRFQLADLAFLGKQKKLEDFGGK